MPDAAIQQQHRHNKVVAPHALRCLELQACCLPAVLLRYCPSRYRVPPGATPPKAAPERKFEGIKLEGGGVSVPAGTVSSLTICAACYADEEGRRAMGAQQRLPAGVTPTDLVCEKLEAMELWDRDPDGDMESEFFETRQVRCAVPCGLGCGICPMPRPPLHSLAHSL